MTVKADQVHRRPSLGQQGTHRVGVGVGKVAFDGSDLRLVGPAAEAGAQARAQVIGIRSGEECPGLDEVAAIGADKGGVDAVERRAAHQADDGKRGHGASCVVGREALPLALPHTPLIVPTLPTMLPRDLAFPHPGPS